MQGMKTAFKSHYMKHKQVILKACALYYGKHRDEAIAASRAWNAKSAVRHPQKHYYASIVQAYEAEVRFSRN